MALGVPEGKHMNKKYNEEILDPESFGGEDFPSLPSKEEMEASLQEFYEKQPLDTGAAFEVIAPHYATVGAYDFCPGDAWIQTYSGRRFTPTNPNPDAIVIQDIAHSLSMQCRFSGHCRGFYSVAQHSVLVSYICDNSDALWGLLHDASEAYLVDVPSPLKRSGQLEGYISFEKKVQEAVCRRFGLTFAEPSSVKKADKVLLATEARDLMSPLRSDWVQTCEPLPFRIEPMSQQDAKNMFMKRFFELTGSTVGYAHYLRYEGKGAI